MRKFITFIGASLIALPILATNVNSKAQGTSYLFTQVAQKALVTPCADKKQCDYQLKLINLNPRVVYFSDRPKRVVGDMTLNEFFKTWRGGNNSFASDHPNVSMAYFGGKALSRDVIEIFNPQYNERANTVTYSVKQLSEGQLKPGMHKQVILFIDDFHWIPGA